MVTLLLFSLVDNEKIHEVCWPFQCSCECSGEMRHVSTDRAQPGLHTEPLDVAIGQLLAPYCPSTSAMVIDGGNTTNTKKKLASD